jgi:hypothetical protein
VEEQFAILVTYNGVLIHAYPNLLPAWPVSLEIVNTMRSSSAGAGIGVK